MLNVSKGKLPSLLELNRMGVSLYDSNGKSKTIKQLLNELAEINLKIN